MHSLLKCSLGSSGSEVRLVVRTRLPTPRFSAQCSARPGPFHLALFLRRAIPVLGDSRISSVSDNHFLPPPPTKMCVK